MKYMDEFRNRTVATVLAEQIKKILHWPLYEHRRPMLIVNEKRPSIIY